MLERNPSMATDFAIPGARHDRLFDNSPEALAAWQAREDAWLEELERIGAPTEIGSRDWATWGILHELFSGETQKRACRTELWQASTTTGWHTNLPFLFDQQPLETADLRTQALARLGEVDRFIDQEIANLRAGLELGYSAPRVTVLSVPEQVRTLTSEDSPFLAFGARAKDAAFEASVQTVFEAEVAPAVERFADFIEDEYLPQAREAIALSEHPDGVLCYPALVRSFATIAPTANQIHQTGLEQMEQIRSEMAQILEQHFGGEAIEAFVRRINTAPEFTFRTENDVLAYSKSALAAARDAMPRAFGVLPQADVLIKPYPAFAASGSGEYHSSSEDGTRPGIFYIAVRDPTGRSRASQLSTLYHETYPGHHLQGAIALERGAQAHPLTRYLWNSGYGEGWALYAERVAQELDLYPTPLDLMGLLSDQAARAARLVIDTGIHTKGWTRQQAVDYMMNNTGWAPVDIENEIDRYISWPGQANSYMLGMLEIRRLRTEAERALGDRFELSEFHDRALENGSVTLPMLEQAVTSWINEAR